MAGKSPIEWTEHTWNPIVGCSIVSPGCTNCYAMKMAGRLEAMQSSKRAGFKPPDHYLGTTKTINDKAVWTGKLAMAPDHILLEPLKRKKPTTYFVNSMGDLFHESVPDDWIDRVFAVMALCPQHTFQVLTKRAERMRAYLTGGLQISETRFDDRATCIKAQAYLWQPLHRHDDKLKAAIAVPLSNVWLGVSTERQQEADERIPLLLQTPAAIRFISAEPLLGPVNLFDYIGPFGPAGSLQAPPALDWVIVGGESGPGARPMHPGWARSLRDQCAAAGVPFFFKQWGAWLPSTELRHPFEHETVTVMPDGRVREWDEGEGRLTSPEMRVMCRLGKKAAGRLLDGVEHNGFPVARKAAAA